MAKKILNIKLQRIIGQIKFRPTIITFDNTALLASDIEDKFEEWRAPKHEDIELFSPSEKKLLQISYDTITYLNEGKADTKELYNYISTIFQRGTKELGLSKIRRIGFRQIQILECSFTFKELVDLTYKKFYSQNEDVKNISIGVPRDTIFVLDGEKNGFLNHVQIGPVNKADAAKYFNSSFPDKKIETGDCNLFIDVDVFINNTLTPENSMDRLNKAIEENLRITDSYIEYIQNR